MSTPYQPEITETEAKDRGLFDCFGKKEEQPKEDVAMEEPEKLQRCNSSSSSSSEEEVEEDGVKIKRKKKKGLTDKIKEKLPGHKDEEVAVLPESGYKNAEEVAVHPEEKKGFLEKIKEKLPGHHKDEAVAPAPAPAPAYAPAHEPVGAAHCTTDGHSAEPQEKKGFLEKIKEKLPGGHKEGDEAKKDH